MGTRSYAVGATLANPGIEVFASAVGNEELGVLGPSVEAFAEANFIVTERFAMGRGRVLFVGRAIPDVAIAEAR